MAIAARLASSLDCEITVFEKNDFLGGRCGSYNVTIPGIGVFRHERGPSLLLLPQAYEELFRDCGTTPEAHGLRYEQCVPAYLAVFDDGDRIKVGFPRQKGEDPSAEEQASRELMDRMEPNGSRKWDDYMEACSNFLSAGWPNFIEERIDLSTLPSFLATALSNGGKGWPLKPHSDMTDAFFASNKLRSLSSFQDLYVGLEPYRNDDLVGGGVLRSTAPAVFGLLSAIELHPTNKYAGIFAPIGGFDAVSSAIHSLSMSFGVRFKLDRTVTSVSQSGITYLDGSGCTHDFSADYIIVNADLPYAEKSLCGSDVLEPPRYDWDDTFDFSCGVLAFHWCVDKSLEDLETHNIFLVAGNRMHMEESWSPLRPTRAVDRESKGQQSMNFYVHRPSNADATAAPAGCDSILVLVPWQHLERDAGLAPLERLESLNGYASQVSDERIALVRSTVLERLGRIRALSDLRDHIVHESVDTPSTYASLYNVGAGTPFGISHGLSQLSLTRPGCRSSKWKNVFYVGASSRPGNGVPLVLTGARLAAACIQQSIRSQCSESH